MAVRVAIYIARGGEGAGPFSGPFQVHVKVSSAIRPLSDRSLNSWDGGIVDLAMMEVRNGCLPFRYVSRECSSVWVRVGRRGCKRCVPEASCYAVS